MELRAIDGQSGVLCAAEQGVRCDLEWAPRSPEGLGKGVESPLFGQRWVGADRRALQ